MKRINCFVSSLDKWRRCGLAVLAGALSVLALAPFNFWPILLATIPVLVWQIDGIYKSDGLKSAKRGDGVSVVSRKTLLEASLLGWSFGFGYFLAGLYWIGSAFLVEADKFAWLMPFAVTLLPLGLALFYGAATAASIVFWHGRASRVFILAISITVTEWIRGHILTGFPWNTFGYTITSFDSLLQWTCIFGIYGLTFFAIVAAGIPAVLLSDSKNTNEATAKHNRMMAAGIIIVVLLGSAAGEMRLHAAKVETAKDIRLRIVQPNIPQIKKWKFENRDWILARMLDLSNQEDLVTNKYPNNVTHIIWPEVALPILLAQDSKVLNAISELIPPGTELITGAIRFETGKSEYSSIPRRSFYNSLYVMDHQSKIKKTYDKIHLVPFGEYLPFQSVLEAFGFEQLTRLRGGFNTGRKPRYMQTALTPSFSPLICYEIIFPGNVTVPGKRPDWLLNITNDAWFGNSSGPYQHFHQARVRAVEEGLPVIRVANTGISAIIDPYGQVLRKLGLNSAGVIEGSLPRPLEATIYAQVGDLTLILLLISAASLYLILIRRENKLSK